MFFLFFFTILMQIPAKTWDNNHNGIIEKKVFVNEDGQLEILIDKAEDGSWDYRTLYDDNGSVFAEELDYNNDGQMDDFRIYQNGVITMHLIDSNYDGQVDIWIDIDRGKYINSVRKDTNFDGTADYEEVFNEED